MKIMRVTLLNPALLPYLRTCTNEIFAFRRYLGATKNRGSADYYKTVQNLRSPPLEYLQLEGTADDQRVNIKPTEEKKI